MSDPEAVSLNTTCWMCGGWGHLDRRDTGERWQREGDKAPYPVFSLHAAPGTAQGELIECPFCGGTGRQGRPSHD